MVDAIFNGMNLTIDKAGRIVVPKALRERFGLVPGSELEAIEQPDGLLLRSIVRQPTMVKVDGLWVHQGVAHAGADWDQVLARLRDDRAEAVSAAPRG